MRPSHSVVFCAIDDLIPVTGKPLTGFPEFLDSLAESGIPCVWLTSRNRLQLDSIIRRLGHGGPFITEDGCGVYLPEDYFHLKPAKTVRLGRFTCIPVASLQPAASEALDLVSEQTGISVVPLRSLSLRELVQNSGLPRQDAELIRQRDFDELFFFAGASDADIQEFRQKAAHLKFSVRPNGPLWSLASNPSLGSCVRELAKLYDRSFHSHAFTIALCTSSTDPQLSRSCDRAILLTGRAPSADSTPLPRRPAPKLLPLFHPDTWDLALQAIQTRHF